MLDLDIFNIFNNATVLGRQYDIRRTGPTGYNQVLEIMNPRILRLGARVNFRLKSRLHWTPGILRFPGVFLFYGLAGACPHEGPRS